MSPIRLALVLALFVSHPATASAAESDRELLRDHIERIDANPETPIAGVQIAATSLLVQLYERHGFELEWTSQAARDDLARAILDSEADGLDPEDYLSTVLARARAAAEAPGAPPDARVVYDLLQTDALVRLLHHLAYGKVDPRTFVPSWTFARQLDHAEPAAFVQQLIDSGEVYERIFRERPQRAFYRRLAAAYARLEESASSGGWRRLADGPTIKPGVVDTRIPALRARLVASGDLDPKAVAAGDTVDPALDAAVRSFQARHGLDVDGSVGRRTRAELNVPIEARLVQLRVNLERGRWLLHELPRTFIVVNAAGFEAYYLRNDAVAWHARAVVGRPYRQTPTFRAEMTYLVLNPTWTVPPTIFAEDVLPEQQRDPGYVDRKGFQVIGASGRVVPAASIDWSKVTPDDFPYLLRQPPGPTNALGRIKFMFPNPYSVYLHDTPSKELFLRGERAFSSGCIRIESPLELAELLLEGQKGWDRAALEAAIAEGKTRTVRLARRVPVLVFYWTAWVDADGVLQLRRDHYGRDEKIADALRSPFSAPAP